MSEPIETPEVDGLSYKSESGLLAALLDGRISLPAWVQIGRSRHRITPETKDAVCRGLLMAIEIRLFEP